MFGCQFENGLFQGVFLEIDFKNKYTKHKFIVFLKDICKPNE